MKSIVAALQFLTRIRAKNTTLRESDMGLSLLWYPIVGLAVGLGCGVIYYAGFRLFWPRLISVFLLIFLLLWVKDAFHMDGLSDLVDGLYGGETPEAVHSIMKDPALGPFGALAMLGVLVLEFGVLYELPPRAVTPVLATAAGLATGSAALLLCWERPIEHTSGLASFLMDQRQWWFGPFLLVVMAGLAVVGLGLVGLILVGVTVLMTLALGFWFRLRLGGINGDCCGASILIVQVLLLLVCGGIDHLGILPLKGIVSS